MCVCVQYAKNYLSIEEGLQAGLTAGVDHIEPQDSSGEFPDVHLWTF